MLDALLLQDLLLQFLVHLCEVVHKMKEKSFELALSSFVLACVLLALLEHRRRFELALLRKQLLLLDFQGSFVELVDLPLQLDQAFLVAAPVLIQVLLQRVVLPPEIEAELGVLVQLLGDFTLAELLVIVERDGHVDPLRLEPQPR